MGDVNLNLREDLRLNPQEIAMDQQMIEQLQKEEKEAAQMQAMQQFPDEAEEF